MGTGAGIPRRHLPVADREDPRENKNINDHAHCIYAKVSSMISAVNESKRNTNSRIPYAQPSCRLNESEGKGEKKRRGGEGGERREERKKGGEGRRRRKHTKDRRQRHSKTHRMKKHRTSCNHSKPCAHEPLRLSHRLQRAPICRQALCCRQRAHLQHFCRIASEHQRPLQR